MIADRRAAQRDQHIGAARRCDVAIEARARIAGNPVSSLITARLFLLPLVRALLGLVPEPARPQTAKLAGRLESNGPRTHYMRAGWQWNPDGSAAVRALPNQDSSLLTPLAAAECLIIRPAGAPAVADGEPVTILPLDF